LSLPARTDISSTTIFITSSYATDAFPVQNILSSISINDCLISVPKPYTLSDASQCISLQLTRKSPLSLQAIWTHDPDIGTFIGSLSLLPKTVDEGSEAQIGEFELGYYVAGEWQGKGIVLDAVCALITGRVARGA
jgi:RimJ/RimL family protein N-acetyltransferase